MNPSFNDFFPQPAACEPLDREDSFVKRFDSFASEIAEMERHDLIASTLCLKEIPESYH